MKADIHPKYYSKAKISCACGNSIKVGSTVEEINTELCSGCHPFFTGTQKILDTARRVEKFKTRITKKSDAPIRTKKAKDEVRKAKRAEKAKKLA